MRPHCEAVPMPRHVISRGAHSVRPHSMAIRVPMNSICTPRRGERPVAYRGHVSVKPGPSLRACGARPSAGWPSHGDKALRGQSGGRREGRFSRRDALCASALQGLARATAFHRATWVAGWPWPKGDMPRSSSWHPSGRAEPAPCILCMSTKYPGYVSTTYTLEYPAPPPYQYPSTPLPLPSTYPQREG